MGGKHRHKYALANRIVKYAEQLLGQPHPFTLISEPDHFTPENAIVVLKTEYNTIDVLDPHNHQYHLVVRLPTNSHEIEYLFNIETAPSSKVLPLTDMAETLVKRALKNWNEIETWKAAYTLLNKNGEQFFPLVSESVVQHFLPEQHEAFHIRQLPEMLQSKRVATIVPSENGQRRP
jgi:hypothetical protein